jgi:hypothetical protein
MRIEALLKVLEKYKEKGVFVFKRTDQLSHQCNAPTHSSGIYAVYAASIKPENLIYIGISGREGKNGEIKHRIDGLGGRIVKGKQFGEARIRSWPKKMKEDGIEVIHVKWFVTYGKFDKDLPRPIENMLLRLLLAVNGKLPAWNKET